MPAGMFPWLAQRRKVSSYFITQQGFKEMGLNNMKLLKSFSQRRFNSKPSMPLLTMLHIFNYKCNSATRGFLSDWGILIKY